MKLIKINEARNDIIPAEKIDKPRVKGWTVGEAYHDYKISCVNEFDCIYEIPYLAAHIKIYTYGYSPEMASDDRDKTTIESAFYLGDNLTFEASGIIHDDIDHDKTEYFLTLLLSVARDSIKDLVSDLSNFDIVDAVLKINKYQEIDRLKSKADNRIEKQVKSLFNKMADKD